MQYLVEFLLVGLSLASAYSSKFDGGHSIDRPTSQDASISNIFKRSKRAAPDVVNRGSSNMNFKYGDSSDSNVVQNVQNHGSGEIREIYGDCSGSSITFHVKIVGSGDLHLVFGNRGQRSNPSTARNNGGEWPQNIISLGSGETDVVYGNCKSSSSRMIKNVNVIGSGDVRIKYGKATTTEMDYDINNSGNGDVYLEYDVCNGGEESGHNVVIVGRGKVYTKCGNGRVNRLSN